MELYCAICDGPLKDFRGSFRVGKRFAPWAYDEEILPLSQTKWIERFRLIGQINCGGENHSKERKFSISPPASNARNRSAIVVGENIDAASVEWKASKDTCILFGKDHLGFDRYPVYDMCLAIIQNICFRNDHQSLTQTNRFSMISDYYDAMLRLHFRYTIYPYGVPDGVQDDFSSRYYSIASYMHWEHKYYGAARFAGRSSWAMCCGWEWLCAPPTEIPNLTSYNLSHLSSYEKSTESVSVRTSFAPKSSNQNRENWNGIETLPNEILSIIISHLQTASVLRLRRCSQTLAHHIVVNQTFWRDQLVYGHLVDFLWDLDAKQCRLKDASLQGSQISQWDWKGLAQMLLSAEIVEDAVGSSLQEDGIHEEEEDFLLTPFDKASLEMGELKWADAPIGLKNRCRLIKIVRDIEKLDRMEAQHSTVIEKGLIRHNLSLFSNIEQMP